MVREALPLGLSGEASEGVRFFRFSDPAFGHDRVTVTVPNDGLNGRILSDMAWINIAGKRDQSRYATVRLRWTEEEESKVALEEVVCWEFLGLGGEMGNASPREVGDHALTAERNEPLLEEQPQAISYREGDQGVDSASDEGGSEKTDSLPLGEPKAPRELPESQ
jgi:hypothetical protein